MSDFHIPEGYVRTEKQESRLIKIIGCGVVAIALLTGALLSRYEEGSWKKVYESVRDQFYSFCNAGTMPGRTQ